MMDLRKLNEWPHLLCRAIEFHTFLVFLEEKWLVSRFSGSREADLHFSLGSFSGHYLVPSDDQSAWSIHKILSRWCSVCFMRQIQLIYSCMTWSVRLLFFLFFLSMAAGLQSELFNDDNICVSLWLLKI